jgi:Domain of unknown function (DUF3394)
VFVFNPAMLLIGDGSWIHTALVATASLIAILLFSAATMNWFVTRSRLWESAVLLLVCFTLFRPDWWLNQFTPPYEERPASEFLAAVEQTPADGRITFVVAGIDLMGEDVRKTVNVQLGDPGEPLQRLQAAGLDVTPAGDTLMITNVAFGSYAKRIGLEVGYDIVALVKKADQPSTAIPIGIALGVTAGIAALQLARRRAAVPEPARTPSR